MLSSRSAQTRFHFYGFIKKHKSTAVCSFVLNASHNKRFVISRQTYSQHFSIFCVYTSLTETNVCKLCIWKFYSCKLTSYGIDFIISYGCIHCSVPTFRDLESNFHYLFFSYNRWQTVVFLNDNYCLLQFDLLSKMLFHKLAQELFLNNLFSLIFFGVHR